MEAIKPATAEEQLASLRKLGLALGRQVASEEHARRVPPPRASWRQTLDVPHPYPVVVFLRFLKLRLGLGHRKTGYTRPWRRRRG